MKTLKAALVAGLVAVLGGTALAHEGAKADLEHYAPIRAALAKDSTDGLKEHAEKLAKSKDKEVAKAAEALAKAADLVAARAAFGDVSKALIAEVEKASKAGEDVGKVTVFECPMAKPYGRWIQSDDDMGNPYYGASMLKCGKEVEKLGKEGKSAHDDHKGAHQH